MKHTDHFSRPLVGLLLAFLPATFLCAQTTLDIDGAARVSNGAGGWIYDTWKPMLGMSGGAQTSPDGYMIDPLNDQQTGQYDSDFIASVSGGQVNSGFLVNFGTINGVEHIGFRIALNEFKTTGNLVNIRVGIDGNNDGVIDLFMGPSLQNNQTGLVFQGTGTGANVSPSTTTLTSAFYPTAAGVGNALAFTADNFSNIELTPANVAAHYPGWGTQDGKNPDDIDALISFAIPLIDINAALAQLDKNFTIGPETFMRWLAFTATQNNSINQDVYGLPKIANNTSVGDTLYTDFLPLMNAYGQPVPEPSYYGLLLAAGLGALLLCRRPGRRTTVTVTPSLEIFTQADVSIAGSGVAYNGKPENFKLWGTRPQTNPIAQSITINGNGVLSAVVYAPNANISMHGGGNSGNVFGSLIGKTITVTGNSAFHYDEALADMDGDGALGMDEWNEFVSYADRSAYASIMNF